MIQHHHVDLNGIRMHYAEAGSGEPLLLLHGFPEYWGVFKRAMRELGGSFRVIAPDQRGANETAGPEDVAAYRIGPLVEDIRALADHLGVERLNLAGQDWGAVVAWAFALRYPARVKRLAALTVPHQALFDRALRERPSQIGASQYMLALRSPDGEAIMCAEDYGMTRALYEPLIARGTATREDLEEHLAALRRPGAITAGLNWYRACEIGPPHEAAGSAGGSNILDGVPESSMVVEAPVLLLLGEKDPYVLADIAEGIERYAPHAIVKRLPEGGHFLTLEAPDFVIPNLREFFSAP